MAQVVVTENRLDWRQIHKGESRDLYMEFSDGRSRAKGIDAKGEEWKFDIEDANTE